MKRAWWLGLLLLGASACEEVTGPAGYMATFDDVAGLKAGGPIYVAGVKVGRVKTVALEEGKAKVELLVEGQHGITMTDRACVSVGRYAFDEDTHIRLVPSKDGTPLDSGGSLTCVETDKELGERMTKVTDAMVKVLEAALDGKGTVGRLLTDEKLADQVVRFFQNGPPARTDQPDEEAEEPDETDESDTSDSKTRDSKTGDSKTGDPKAGDPKHSDSEPAPRPRPVAPPVPGDLKDPFDGR